MESAKRVPILGEWRQSPVGSSGKAPGRGVGSKRPAADEISAIHTLI
jgi:hypothetical protein